MSNLLYRCNDCSHEWDELRSHCPQCGSENFTIIDRPRPPLSKWIKLILFLFTVVASIFAFWYFLPPPDPSVEELKPLETFPEEGRIQFNKNIDSYTFMNQHGSKIIKDNNSIYPCQGKKEDEITWKSSEEDDQGRMFLEEDLKTNEKACKKACTYVISHDQPKKINGKLTWSFKVKAIKEGDCESCKLQFRLDDQKWSTNNSFNCDELSKHNKVYARYNCDNCNMCKIDPFTINKNIFKCPTSCKPDAIKTTLETKFNNYNKDKYKDLRQTLADYSGNDIQGISVVCPDKIYKNMNIVMGKLRRNTEFLEEYEYSECKVENCRVIEIIFISK